MWFPRFGLVILVLHLFAALHSAMWYFQNGGGGGDILGFDGKLSLGTSI